MLAPTRDSSATRRAGGAGRPHRVQFYDDERFLAGVVADFLAEGQSRGEAGVIIATAGHRAAITERLQALGGEAWEASGQRILLDAEECLASFMVEGMPDGGRFEAMFAPLLRRLANASGGLPVRAYGEMVDLVWKQGQAAAAIRLEELWNELASAHDFSLLCAYEMRGFLDADHTGAFSEICRQHTHVRPTESCLEHEDDRGMLEVALLQQRARALEKEIERRETLERGLREALAEKTLAETELRTHQQALNDFFENAVEGIHAVAADGTILWANRAEFELLGYTKVDYVGRNIREIHADRDVIDDIFARLGRNETLRDHPARLRCKDGSIKHVRIHSNAAFRDGVFQHTRCFTRDVTGQHLMEQELERQNAELLRAVRFSEMFLGMLGHDLRNPLSAIATSARLLARRPLNPDVEKRSRRILTSSARMGRMIDQILDFTRIRLGNGFQLDCRKVDLAEVCRAAIEELDGEHERDTVESTAEGELTGCWDADRLIQLLSNLIGNALVHRSDQTPVRVHLNGSDPAQVRVEIRNAGVIPEALLPTLFEPLKSAIKREGSSGLGLGLYISAQIAQAHGGTIEVSSSDGAGTCFAVNLPTAGAPELR